MLLLAVCCLPVIPMTWMFVREEIVKERPMFRKYIGDLWGAIQSRAVYQVIAYSFLSGVFSGFTYVAQDPMTSYWVHATSFNLSLSSIFGSFVTVVTLTLTGKYGLHWNWRTMQVVTMVSVIALDAMCTMLVTWDIVRKQWFWLGVPIVEAVPDAVGFIISTYVVVELAGHGNEGAIYGLLTTVSNLGGPFALTLTKNVNAAFKVYNEDILNDTLEVRRDVTITILISYVMKLLALLFLPLLPRQKAEAQALKRSGGSSRRMGAFTIAYLSFALVWAILTNLLGIFESTRCWVITGGWQRTKSSKLLAAVLEQTFARRRLSADALVLLLGEGRVELARLVDGVAVDVGEAEATRAPVRAVLALVVHGAVALALVEAHVRVVQQIAAGRGAGGHGSEAADDDDREGAAVRGPELEEAHAGARCLGGHGGRVEEVVVGCLERPEVLKAVQNMQCCSALPASSGPSRRRPRSPHVGDARDTRSRPCV
ncbi:hypothetical protein ON010_g1376 [Phytophthora cinnamomi]|nr:hypothetical protein ON010_g1376 [Phytophthora cinnamomi]